MVGAVGWRVVVGRRPMGVALQTGVGVSVGVRVGVRVGGRVAVMERADLVHGVDVRTAVVDVQVGGGQVLVRGRPQVAGEGLQSVVPDRARLRVLAAKVALAKGGDAAAGAA